jgi:hypothetical protein
VGQFEIQQDLQGKGKSRIPETAGGSDGSPAESADNSWCGDFSAPALYC